MRHFIVARLGGAYATSGAAPRRARWLAMARACLSGWRERARSRRSLHHLDARMLRDIGLTPADVERECRKPFWQG
jgi:uncharacterized protein YjiS (DUF1127 family)